MIENSTILINLLGQLLKKIRAEKAWPQEEFATISDISTRTLQRIEGGEKANTETLQQLSFFSSSWATIPPERRASGPRH